MRIIAALLAITTAAPLIGATFPTHGNAKTDAVRARQCPGTARYLADQAGIYRRQPLTPRKLTELPPATTYMAVYRHIGVCDDPLTMVEYRNPRRH